jgi:hypothetical protein
MASNSFVDEMIDRSFKTFQSSNPKAPNVSRPVSPSRTLSQFEEKFLREMAGIDTGPLHVKADLGKELEVVDKKGQCFYVSTNDLWRP